MRHDWILDVLTDLHAYACRNEMPGLAVKVEAALLEAIHEIGEPEGEACRLPSGPPSGERPN